MTREYKLTVSPKMCVFELSPFFKSLHGIIIFTIKVASTLSSLKKIFLSSDKYKFERKNTHFCYVIQKFIEFFSSLSHFTSSTRTRMEKREYTKSIIIVYETFAIFWLIYISQITRIYFFATLQCQKRLEKVVEEGGGEEGKIKCLFLLGVHYSCTITRHVVGEFSVSITAEIYVTFALSLFFS